MEFKLNKDKDMFYYGEEFDPEVYLLFPKNDDDTQTITKVYVDEKYRGKGIASKLMKEVVEYAKKNNIILSSSCSYATSWFEKHK